MATPKAIASASSSPVAAGAFTDELNQPLTVAAINGYLMIKMAVQDFSVATLTGGGQVMATESIKINLDANGIPVAGQSMFASDQFSSPVNPPFNVFIYNGSSREVGVIKNAVISGSAPIDLTALTSTAVGASFPSPVLQIPGSPQSITGQPLTLTGTAPLVVQSSIAISNTGVFTGSAMSEYLTMSINGGSSLTEWQAEQGATYQTTGLSVAMVAPASASKLQTNAIAAFLQANAPSTNTVALYGQTRANADSVHMWGGNTVVDDKSKTGVTMTAFEFDANVNNPGTLGAGIQINGAFAGNPTSFPAIQIAAPVGGGKWTQGLSIAGTDLVIEAGPSTPGNSVTSGAIALDGRNSGGLLKTAFMRASANGDWQIWPQSTRGVGIQSGSALTPRGTLEVSAQGATPDPLNVDISHNVNITDGGNTGLQIGFSDTGTLRAFLQARNNVGANNAAYLLTLNELGGNVVVGSSTDGGQTFQIVGTARISDMVQLKRIRANQGTAYSGADAAIVLSAGWGTTKTVSAATGYDQGFSFAANSSGTGQAANPTITITFKDGTWTNAPIIQVLRNDLSTPFNTPPHTWSVTATALTITFNGTPTAGNSYSFSVMVMGT